MTRSDISHSIIDIATPPSGGVTPFNVYAALSRGRGRDNIRLLQNFDEKVSMSHPCEHLRVDDERLTRLDVNTEKWWYQKTQESGEELPIDITYVCSYRLIIVVCLSLPTVML